MHHPDEVDDDCCRITKLKHYISTTCIQALLYTTEARKCDSTWTVEDLPRTSYTAKDRPEKGGLRYHLYRTAFNKYDLIQQVIGGATEHANPLPSREISDEAQSKLVQLLPLAFEALLFMTASDTSAAPSLNQVAFVHIINQASELKAPAKTFALLADLILSSTMLRAGHQAEPPPELPLSMAISLLSKVINAIRSQSEYDVVRASRWIRCVVQLVLERTAQTEERKSGSSDERESNLQVVASVVDEALALARDAGHDHTTDCYPSDELHWLSSTLFNLAVDYYTAANDVEAKKWVAKATEVADALARNPRKQGGDDGALARALKERCGQMVWNS